MTTFRSEETLVGLISLAAVPWIVLRVRRGLRERKLPIGRSYLLRDERAGAFRALTIMYLLAALAMAFIGIDLLLGLTGRS